MWWRNILETTNLIHKLLILICEIAAKLETFVLPARGLPSKERLCLVHTESYFPGKQKSNTQLSLYFCTQHHILRRAKRAWWTDTSLLARWVVKMYFYFFASTWVAQVSNQKMNANMICKVWAVKSYVIESLIYSIIVLHKCRSTQIRACQFLSKRNNTHSTDLEFCNLTDKSLPASWVETMLFLFLRLSSNGSSFESKNECFNMIWVRVEP